MPTSKKQSGSPARRKRPRRTCIVCRQNADKRDLIRLVKTPDSGVLIDPSGKLPGRGAYLCSRKECWQTAATSGVLERALRTTLTPEDRERIASAAPASEGD